MPHKVSQKRRASFVFTRGLVCGNCARRVLVLFAVPLPWRDWSPLQMRLLAGAVDNDLSEPVPARSGRFL